MIPNTKFDLITEPNLNITYVVFTFLLGATKTRKIKRGVS